MSQPFKTSDVVAGQPLGLETIKEIGAQVHVLRSLFQ